MISQDEQKSLEYSEMMIVLLVLGLLSNLGYLCLVLDYTLWIGFSWMRNFLKDWMVGREARY